MLLTWSKAVYDANHNDLRIGGLRELKRSLNAAPAQIGIRNALADDLLELRSKRASNLPSVRSRGCSRSRLLPVVARYRADELAIPINARSPAYDRGFDALARCHILPITATPLT
jgi:hypothetical protein